MEASTVDREKKSKQYNPGEVAKILNQIAQNVTCRAEILDEFCEKFFGVNSFREMLHVFRTQGGVTAFTEQSKIKEIKTIGERKGFVRRYDRKKGFGFLAVEGEDFDAFVHHTDILMEGFRELEEDEEVTFELCHQVRMESGKETSGYVAKKVKLLYDDEDEVNEKDEGLADRPANPYERD